MGQYSFKMHRTTLKKDGFNILPEEVVETCNEAIVFYKYDGVFVLCDIDAFSEFRDKILDRDDRNIVMLRRHLFNSIAHFETAENLVLILWDLINHYEKEYVDCNALEIEMRPYNMVFYGEESKNQFIEIKVLSAKK